MPSIRSMYVSETLRALLGPDTFHRSVGRVVRFALTGAWACTAVWAQAQALPAGVAASVNGVTITKAQVDQAVAAASAQGRPDSPELRQSIIDQLIVREVLAQESARQKLDRSAAAKIQLAAARQNVLVDLLLADHLAKNPISDAAMATEYQRQVRMIEERGGSQQYRLRQITVATEAEARQLIARIRKGESMADLAKQYSGSPSKEQGGLLDWLSPLQMLPAVSNVIVNLQAETLAAAPIATPGGWNVLKVEAIRSVKPPSFEQTRDQIREALAREQRSALIRKLRAEAKVVTP